MGAGNGGRAVAAYLSLCGYAVNLYEHPKFLKSFSKILRTKEIYTEGILGENRAILNMATIDLEPALVEAKVIFVITPAYAHKAMAEVLAKYVKKPQVIVLMPGSGGSLEFARVLREKTDISSEIVLAEASTLPFGARIKESGVVSVFIKAKLLPIGIFPSKHAKEVISLLKEFFPVLVAAKDVLEAAINNPNHILHPPSVLLSTTLIEHLKGDYCLYEEGLTPSLARILEALNSERLSLCDALGYELYHCDKIDFRSINLGETPQECRERIFAMTMGAFFGKDSLSAGLKMRGPSNLQDRYISEDVPYGMVLQVALGKLVGVPMTIHEAIINLTSIINRINYWETGRNIKRLGLDGMDLDKIKTFLYEGKLG